MTKMNDLAMILNYSTSVWGASKTDREVSREVLTSKGAEDRAGKFTKHLLGGSCPELEAIRSHVHQFQTWLRAATFPSSMMGRGSCIVPNGKLLEICQECRRYEQQFSLLVQQFIDKYDDIVIEAKRKLANLATDEYPSKQAVRNKFDFRFHVMPIPEAAQFDRKLGFDEFEQALADQYEREIAKTCQEGEEQLIEMLKARLLKFHNALITYTGEGRGSGAILSQKVTDAALDEVKNIKSLNFRKRQDISQWCGQAIQILGKSARELRVNPIVRDRSRQQLEELLINMGVEIPNTVTPAIITADEPAVEASRDFSYADLFSH